MVFMMMRYRISHTHSCGFISFQNTRKFCLLNSAKQQFVSYTSNWLEQTYDIQMCTKFTLRSILSLQDLLQNRSLETVPVCIVWPCFPHGNTVCSHMCDEYKKSNEPSVCHKLWTIWWLLAQVCLLTTECLVYQCVPHTGISGQFKSILVTILQQIPIPLLWIDGHQGMEL